MNKYRGKLPEIKEGDYVKLDKDSFEYGDDYTWETHKYVMNHINSGNRKLKVKDVCSFDFPFRVDIRGKMMFFKRKELIKVN